METTVIASRFVDLALKYNDQWNKVTQLFGEDVQVLFEIVSAAGFDPKKVVPGILVGHYRDEDGESSETYQINSLCPFKVVVSEEDGDHDHYFATGWLDCCLRRVVFGASRNKEDRQKLVEAIAAEIERSIPLQPIQLTPWGDLLRESSRQPLFSGLKYFVDHVRDDHELSSCVGIHMYCGGYIDRDRATKMHDRLLCRLCHLRVLFPKEVKTYGELRRTLIPSKYPPIPA